jgi:hypothetical protein
MKIICLLLSLLSLAGCADDIEKMKLTQEEKQHVLALQNPFGNAVVSLSPSDEKGPILIGLKNCTVYRAEPEQGVVTEWVRISQIGFYLLPTSCFEQRITSDGPYVKIEFCQTPIGAGGGCAGGIDPHRSKNGKDWEVYEGKGRWKPI